VLGDSNRIPCLSHLIIIGCLMIYNFMCCSVMWTCDVMFLLRSLTLPSQCDTSTSSSYFVYCDKMCLWFDSWPCLFFSVLMLTSAATTVITTEIAATTTTPPPPPTTTTQVATTTPIVSSTSGMSQSPLYNTHCFHCEQQPYPIYNQGTYWWNRIRV